LEQTALHSPLAPLGRLPNRAPHGLTCPQGGSVFARA